MSDYRDDRALQRLLDELGRLPGIGPKSAQRIAYFLLEADIETARRLSNAIIEVKQQVHFCPICFNYATREHCDVCDDVSRDRSVICVVSEPRDVSAIERTGSYHGETTATYLSRVIRPLGIDVSRLASGLPVGGDLEYADEVTLGRAIEARRTL